MKMEQTTINQYVELYDAIQEKAPSEDVAIAILQELGKDKRSLIISEAREAIGATDKQKKFMKDLGIEFPKDVSRKTASVLIDEHLNRA